MYFFRSVHEWGVLLYWKWLFLTLTPFYDWASWPTKYHLLAISRPQNPIRQNFIFLVDTPGYEDAFGNQSISTNQNINQVLGITAWVFLELNLTILSSNTNYAWAAGLFKIILHHSSTIPECQCKSFYKQIDGCISKKLQWLGSAIWFKHRAL